MNRGVKNSKGKGNRGFQGGKGGSRNQKSPAGDQTSDDGRADSPTQRGENTSDPPHSRKNPVARAPAKIPQVAQPNLKPAALSSAPSTDKNDPLLMSSILVEGVSGMVEATTPKQFKLDFSQFNQIVLASYNQQVTTDRGLKKYISFSMMQYYCTVALWRRLYHACSRRGLYIHESSVLERMLPEEMPLPIDVKAYIDGVGNLRDDSGREFHLNIHALSEQIVAGVSGTFGMVDDHTHIMYETAPSPFVAVWKMVADLNRTMLAQPDGLTNWDLPAGVRPANVSLTVPTANLLGWRPAANLTLDQRDALLNAGLNTYTPANPHHQRFTNIGHIPINLELIQYVAGQCTASKVKAFSSALSTSTMGSLAQVLFITRGEDTEPNPTIPISSKLGVTNSYSQQPVHIVCGGMIMRYRVKRYERDLSDMYCYQGEVPEAWALNENSVYEFGRAESLWNLRQFRVAEQSGELLAINFSSRVRKSITRD